MDEELKFFGKYMKCVGQVLLIDFKFTEKDIFKLMNCVDELYHSSLKEYLESRNSNV